MYTIAIVESRLYREAIKALLCSHKQYKKFTLSEFENGAELLHHINHTGIVFDIVLINAESNFAPRDSSVIGQVRQAYRNTYAIYTLYDTCNIICKLFSCLQGL